MEEASSKDKLIRASLELIAELGFRGATTRKIAERAGVNEVTLFRLFGTKLALFAEAFLAITRGFREGLEHPSGNLETDLHNLATNYSQLFALHRGVVIRILPELSQNQSLQTLLGPFLKRTSSQVFALFKHYEETGELIKDDPKNLALAFLGPLAARVLIGPALDKLPALDVKEYVRQFLDGRRITRG
ncbi:MAG: TetR/AcrR family transcriptional regulator [Trueperaceae bacterium]|nr:TetR/AcrR family transcriptional regulator [Trueperaceae bacterium]